MDIGVWAAVQVGIAQHRPCLVGSTGQDAGRRGRGPGADAGGLAVAFYRTRPAPGTILGRGTLPFPGGRIEADDPSPQAAAERETLEEVGLDLSSAEYWGRVDDLTGHMLPVVVSGFVYRLATPAALWSSAKRSSRPFGWGPTHCAIPVSGPSTDCGTVAQNRHFQHSTCWGRVGRCCGA